MFDDYDLIGMARMRMCLCIHIAKEDIAVHEGASFRAINAAELRKLCEVCNSTNAGEIAWFEKWEMALVYQFL